MPDLAVGTFVSTEEIAGDERVIDMDPTMRKLDPDTSQFTTMLSRMPSRPATREKVNWLEETYVTNVFTVDAAYTSGALTVSVGTVESAAIKANDILRNMTTGEALLVTAVGANGDLTVVPSVGSVASAAGNIGDKLVFIGSAFEQGAPLPDPKYSTRVLGFNYTEIFRSSWEFSGTATAIELYGGREPAKEAARKAVEHKRELEHNAFFGARDWYTTGTGPRGAAGGLIEFIVTNKQDVNGELTSDFLDLFLTTVLAKGSSDKVIFTGTVGAYYISRWNRSGQGAFWAPRNESVHGVKVDGFINGVFGYQIPVVVKKEWSNYPSGDAGYNGSMFIVDMTNIERRPLRDRDTKLLTNRQNPGDDKYAAEYLTEATWAIANEKTHGLLTGIA
jgi:hypothetical protein